MKCGMQSHNFRPWPPDYRGRTSITEARERLGLELLAKRRRNHRLSLLNKILSNESKHSALASACDEISQD